MSYSLRAGSGRLSWSCSQAVSKPVWHIPLLCVRWKTADDGQRNCLKHVEFYSKNKFERLVHLIGFIIRIYHDARSSECHIPPTHMREMQEKSLHSRTQTQAIFFNDSFYYRQIVWGHTSFPNTYSVQMSRNRNNTASDAEHWSSELH